ncbi:MAG: NAD-dependent epimerase/dehydratase family protein [Selenomonadaceae bacterium]|nr:NAD-dependent epimerase/dehydratase family protein [Selenomonadaceae bacterium]
MYINNQLYIDDVERLAALDLPWSTLDGKNILITGATGMIGTTLVDVLMRKGLNKIFAAGRKKAAADARFADYLNDDRFEFVSMDVNALNVDEFSERLKVDVIIHAASNTHPVQYATDPVGSIMSNILGTYNLLELGRRLEIDRFVFVSSVEIYGQARGDDDFDEKYCGYIDCNSLRAGYPEGKRAGEALCNAYIGKFGLDVVIPRLSRCYGPTMRLDDSKAMSQFLMNGVKREDIVLKSEGLPRFSYCYSSDAVGGLLYCLLKGAKGEAYNVSDSSEIMSLREIAEYIAAISDRKVVFELPDAIQRAGFSKVVKGVMLNDKLRALGWEPHDDTRSGVKKTIEILRSIA